jgi:hypothetical protein
MSEDRITTLQLHQNTLAKLKHLKRGDETNEDFLIRLLKEYEIVHNKDR